ncbi:MAG: hypothetical protein HOW73_26260 [Polyangiaceae bacterium]|nr:hypothetical protein [Polyangiaceae bacterium]
MMSWRPAATGGTLSLTSDERPRLLAVDAVGGSVDFDGALVFSGILQDGVTSDGIGFDITHPLSAPRVVHVPHLSPEEGDVVGDAVFRSPAIILADEAWAVAFIVDVDEVARADGYRQFLDYDHRARRISFRAGAYEERGHVFYRRRPIVGRGQRASIRIHVLASDDPLDVENPYGMAARWVWQHWGSGGHASGGSQRAPLPVYADYVVRWAFGPDGWEESVWQSFELDGREVGAPVFIVDVSRHPSVPPEDRRWREPRSIWNQAWFSTQRCANGLLRHARRIRSRDLEERARKMTEIAFAAPQSGGLFPSVVRPRSDDVGWASTEWTSSDRRPPGASAGACHIVDAAFTCRLLLEWHALSPDPRIAPFVKRFAERLVSLQLSSGAFPGWVEPDGSCAPELLESAESAMAVALLFELASSGNAPAGASESARRGITFLESIIGDARWEDFETYYSCAPWGAPELLGKRVPRNGAHKQNTLGIAWTADAMLRAYEASSDPRFLRLARRCIDELSLYQAVWDPPFLPAPAHGGFGVMNADSEWNDARQSLFAPLYLQMYRHTGDVELFERGVSALRASFSMMYCPENEATKAAYERRFPFFGEESYGFMMENQGHSGGDPIGTFTIFTWGNGSGLATAAKVHDLYGDVFIDVPRARALAVDVTSAEIRGPEVHVHDRYERPQIVAVWSDGRRHVVQLSAGRGTFPLE